MAEICRLRRLFFNTAGTICTYSNKRCPFPSDLERFAEADSLTLDELVETASVFLLDQRACTGLCTLQPALAFLKFLNGSPRCELVHCCADNFFLVDVDGKFQGSLWRICAECDGGDGFLRRIWAEDEVGCKPVEGKKRWNLAGRLENLRQIGRAHV